MEYISSRDKNKTVVSSAQAIKRGQAPDGGLYVPTSIPHIDQAFIDSLAPLDYAARAAKILELFLTDYTHEELLGACCAAYGGDRFDPNPAPVAKVGDNNVLELWHGPTCAFKDLALQLLPRLLSLALDKTGEKRDALILVATSGDTGKAALEGYKDVDRVKITVFYPTDGVSNMQKLQMASQEGKNVNVCAIRGNFDDAQTGVKRIFSDASAAAELDGEGYFLTSANSINFGRLAPQIVYYFSAYCDMLASGSLKRGEKLNVTVPTGNFGNILACYIAKLMGLPIGRLICATNKNKVLADYFNSGVYDKNRRFYTTVSPSMDILVSSNLERLVYFEYGAEFTASAMDSLKNNGSFKTPFSKAFDSFVGLSCDEEKTFAVIRDTFDKYTYCPDPHTAVAISCADEYKRITSDNTPMLIVSTASPYKFPYAVGKALGVDDDNAFMLLKKLSDLTKTKIPSPLARLENAKVRFGDLIDDHEMKNAVLVFARNSKR